MMRRIVIRLPTQHLFHQHQRRTVIGHRISVVVGVDAQDADVMQDAVQEDAVEDAVLYVALDAAPGLALDRVLLITKPTSGCISHWSISWAGRSVTCHWPVQRTPKPLKIFISLIIHSRRNGGKRTGDSASFQVMPDQVPVVFVVCLNQVET